MTTMEHRPAREAREFRPVVPCYTMDLVAALTGRTKDRVKHLIESGELCHVINVGALTARARELRFLPDCVMAWVEKRKCTMRFDDVISLLIPYAGPEVTGPEIYRCLNITDDLSRYFRAGSLKVSKPGRTGRTGAARITRKSFCDFVQSRLVS